MKKFAELKKTLSDIEKDAEQFYNHANKAAGTRVRVGLQKVKQMASIIRVDIQDKKKNF